MNQIFINSVHYFDITQKNISSFFINRVKLNSTLYKENTNLKNQNIDLKNQIEKLKLDATENDSLKKEINYHNSLVHNIITTELFAITPGPYKKEAFISAGKEEMVEQGDIILYKDMLLGRVIEVYKGFSKVLLIFDSRSKISAVTSLTRKKILLEGNNTNKLFIKYLPETEEIQEEEFVETSNYCSLFPSGIKIGLISLKNNMFPELLIPYRIRDIRFVKIIHYKNSL